jgi:hypothetical protein
MVFMIGQFEAVGADVSVELTIIDLYRRQLL